MNTDDFIENFADQFDETDLNQFSLETNFRDLDEWDSLIALSVIAMVDSEYNVQISGDDIRGSNTIKDIFTIVNARANKS